MKIADPLFVPSKHKFNLSKSPIWNMMEKDITIACRFNPDWVKITESYDSGVVIKNGQHAGIQVSHERGYGFIKGIVWVEKEDGTVGPEMTYIAVDKIPSEVYLWSKEAERKTYDVVFHHSHDRKQITIMLGLPGWDRPYVEEIRYEGKLVDYSTAWLWIGCCNGLDGVSDQDAGWYHGDIDFVGIFRKPFSDSDFIEYFREPESHNKAFWKEKKVITYVDFKTRTPYKFRDESGNSNNVNIYKPEWGDLF